MEYKTDVACLRCGKTMPGVRAERKYCDSCRKKDKTKKVKKPGVLESKVDTTQCRTCEYWEKYLSLCDYISIEGHSRPCEPSPNCTVYKKRGRGARRVNIAY